MTQASLRRLAWLYSALLVAIVVGAGRGALPFELLTWVPGGDKTCHFLLMGLLCLLVNLAFARGNRAVMRLSLLVALVVTLEELSQVALYHRRFESADLAADIAGITVFAWLASILLARRRRQLAAVASVASAAS